MSRLAEARMFVTASRAGGLSPSRYEFATGGGQTPLFKGGVR
jgi:hypothetical protein